MRYRPGRLSFTAPGIADRIGRSEKFVWDRMKLLDLIPEAKRLLEAGRMTAGHAILIARLKPADQARVIDPADGGLFEHDNAFEWDDDGPAKTKPGPFDGIKAVSVRELEKYIAEYVRFDVTHAAAAAPLDFGPIAERVQEAAAKPGRGKKVIAITFEHYIQPAARDEKERTYGPRSFKFADGEKHYNYATGRTTPSPRCDHSVLGVVAAGEQYGRSFDVCIARDKCEVHWKQETAAREKNATLRAKGQTGRAQRNEAAAEARERQAEEARQKQRARWDRFLPALRKAVHAALPKVKVKGHLYEEVLKAHRLPKGTKPADLPTALLADVITSEFGRAWYNDEPRLVKWARRLGVDPKKVEAAACGTPVQTAAVPKATKKKGRKS